MNLEKKIVKGLNIFEIVSLLIYITLLLFNLVEPSKHLLVMFCFIFLMKSIFRYLENY